MTSLHGHIYIYVFSAAIAADGMPNSSPPAATPSRLARELNHHLFDTLYHALALEQNTTLITADHRYFRKSVNQGSICKLEDFDINP